MSDVCKRGHPFDEANTYRDPDGARNCKTCRRDNKRRWRAARRGDTRPMWVRALDLDAAGAVVEVPLSGGKAIALIDRADLDLVASHSWQLNNGYAMSDRQANGVKRKVLMHRVIADAAAGTEVDHINRERLDNRRANLRSANRSEQERNSGLRRTNRSGFKGVSLNRNGRWYACIRIDGRSTNLGTFDTAREAGEAYDHAARAAYGAFACTNEDLRGAA